MAYVPKETGRSQQARPDKSGKPTFTWQLTHTDIRDTVKLIMPPTNVLPIVFVPGIMGSNLAMDNGTPVWLLNSTVGQPIGLAWRWARKGPGPRQNVLHPARTRVYSGGDVPGQPVGTIHNTEEFTSRGWGEVGETSYHAFLLWLEHKLNGEGFNPARWDDFFFSSVSAALQPGQPATEPKLFSGTVMQMNGLPTLAEQGHIPEPITSDELIKRAKFRFPVYACGYNWLASNKNAAERLKGRINEIIAENNVGAFICKQVILVTHSMGGLVARACSQLPGIEEKIAGIVHGVMPAVGAAVAYRRCKIGMRDEDLTAGLVIGSTGKEVTAVFAQAPGALQLLPSHEYRSKWLHIKDQSGKTIEHMPVSDPYTEIYLEKNRWWGLVKEEWLDPADGTAIEWDEFSKNVDIASEFHRALAGKYHPNSFVYYGAGDGEQASFETIRWTMKRGIDPHTGAPPTVSQTLKMTHQQVREEGEGKIYVGGATKFETGGGYAGFGIASAVAVETAFWEISCEMQDGVGDGTVPASSGMAPRVAGGKNIRQQFRLDGFSHEPAYKDSTAQRVTHYAIIKIAALAKIS
jgi:pimeloyl-ACP methyl ester carboxylesterase